MKVLVTGATGFIGGNLARELWRRGEDVRVVGVRGVKYLRTDRNNVQADNLGALPRLSRAAG